MFSSRLFTTTKVSEKFRYWRFLATGENYQTSYVTGTASRKICGLRTFSLFSSVDSTGTDLCLGKPAVA
jgi:hypothetical protein